MKETFIIRTEWFDAISELQPKEQAIILNNLFNFHLGNDDLIDLDIFSVKLVWKLIQPNLTRNIEKYDNKRNASRENGKLGGRPRKNLNNEQVIDIEENKKPKNNLKNLNNPKVNAEKPNNPIVSVSDSVSVSVSVSDSDYFKEIDFAKNLEFKNICLKSMLWQDQVQMKFKRIEIPKMLDKYTNHLSISQVLKSNLKDYKSHFNNWLNKLPEEEKIFKKITTKEMFML